MPNADWENGDRRQQRAAPDESRSTAYGICSMNSNAMKSKNLDSGFYEAQTSRTLDCKGGNPTCNQGGILIVSEKHPVYAIGRDCVSVHKDKAQTLTAELLPGSVAQPLSIGNGQAHSLSMDEKAGTLNCMRDQQAVMVPKAVDTSHADDKDFRYGQHTGEGLQGREICVR